MPLSNTSRDVARKTNGRSRARSLAHASLMLKSKCVRLGTKLRRRAGSTMIGSHSRHRFDAKLSSNANGKRLQKACAEPFKCKMRAALACKKKHLQDLNVDGRDPDVRRSDGLPKHARIEHDPDEFLLVSQLPSGALRQLLLDKPAARNRNWACRKLDIHRSVAPTSETVAMISCPDAWVSPGSTSFFDRRKRLDSDTDFTHSQKYGPARFPCPAAIHHQIDRFVLTRKRYQPPSACLEAGAGLRRGQR